MIIDGDRELCGRGRCTGRVLSIQRMSTEDGPGLRSTVFFKGCSLACAWCHNPESIRPKPQVVWHRFKCIGCCACAEVCSHGAVSMSDDGAVQRDGERCAVCGACVAECPTTALELVGTDWTVDALFDEVVKDRAYFGATGGVTMSGGEPALQSAFAARFAGRCRDEGLHVALDTCGQVGPSAMAAVVEVVDLVLYDLKIIDPDQHARYTGQDNRRILANLDLVGARLRAAGGALWIRTPLIPGATDSHANIAAIGAHVAEHVGDLVSRWELGAFNNLCQDKYGRLGIEWRFADCPAMTEQQLAELAAVARASGVDPTIVVATGPTRRASVDDEGAAKERGAV